MPPDLASAQAFKNATAYRPEIDGLRAVAVTVVVLFHAGLPGFSGGFAGVDMFFVISGYLITGLLVRELLEAGRIDILDFYARRVRRILPAFTVVMLATLAAAPFMLTPAGEQQDLATSATAAAAFVSNIYFWRTQTGYFAGPADQFPLLHMWTLAVEEQFYIVWPVTIIFLAAIARWFPAPIRRTLLTGFVLACAVSLLACIIVTPLRTTMAFYVTPFRVWEFGTGALLSILLPGSSWDGARPGIAAFMVVPGWAAIIASVVLFDKNTLFPGYTALLPVIGTASILAGFSAAPRDSRVMAPFRSLPAVIIGKLSYSWYLWHWPLLALVRAYALGEHDLARDLGLVALALVLSALTYLLVEQPIRARRPWPFANRGSAVIAGCLLLCTVVATSFVLGTTAEARLASSPAARAAREAATSKFTYPAHCNHFRLPFAGLAPVSSCTVGGAGPTRAVLWGDSHASHFLPAFETWGQRNGLSTLPRVMGDCRPYTLDATSAYSGLRRQQQESCAQFNHSVLSTLPALKQQGAEVVVLSARWSHPSQYQRDNLDWGAHLKAAVKHIRGLGLPVVLIADIPGYHYNVPQCIARRGAEGCTQIRRDVETSRIKAVTILQDIAASDPGVRFIDPIDMLCDARSCRTMHNGTVLYSDYQHLSVAASQSAAVLIGTALAHIFTPRREQ